MPRVINLDIELLPEGVYLGTSDDVPGLVVQMDTIPAVIEVALDLSPTLLEWHEGRPSGALAIVERLREHVPIAAE